MHALGTRLLLLLLLLGGWPATAHAQNPRLSLRLENANPAEAAVALGRAAGVALDLSNPTLPAALAGEAGPPPRASFAWQEVRFAHALRELCAKFGLAPVRRVGGYTLWPRAVLGPADAAAEKPLAELEKNGVRLTLRPAKAVNRPGQVILAGNRVLGPVANLTSYTLECRLPDGDADALVGVTNLVVEDERGNPLDVLINEERDGGGSPFPDEWRRTLAFSPPEPGARRLARIEGEVFAHRVFRRHQVELALEPGSPSAKWAAESSSVELLRYTPQGLQTAGPEVQLRVTLPTSGLAGDDRLAALIPLAVGESGRTYAPVVRDSTGSGNARQMTYVLTCAYHRLDEPVARVRLRFVEQSEPERLVSFRFRNIPLPPPPGGGEVPPLAAAKEKAGPFAALGGGSLATRVEFGDRPAGPGILSLGMAQRTPAGWTPIRWMELDVDDRGNARLDDLQPGVYRVLRTYRPEAEGPEVPAGRWLNGDVRVEISPGKPVELPPLRRGPSREPRVPGATSGP